MIFRHKSIYYFYFLISIFLINCSSDNDAPIIDDEPQEVSPVVFDINAVPYEKLSDYNLFKSPMSDMNPVYGVLPFQPASQLFTDYALKKRFMWMPDGQSANYVADNKSLNFPTGTILVKNFYYENVLPNNSRKIIETRLMIKKADEWIFANYVWNADQTEATHQIQSSFVQVEWLQNGITKNVNYKIPSRNDCAMCHYISNKAAPIGPKPQNMNFAINFADGSKNQLEKLEEFGYLNTGKPANITSIIDYNDTSKSLDLRARSYIEINCAHCHIDGGYAEFYPVRLGFTATADLPAMGACLPPNINITDLAPEASHIIYPGNNIKSVIYQRMNTRIERIKMPMIGRESIHEEGVALVSQWINSLEGECL